MGHKARQLCMLSLLLMLHHALLYSGEITYYGTTNSDINITFFFNKDLSPVKSVSLHKNEEKIDEWINMNMISSNGRRGLLFRQQNFTLQIRQLRLDDNGTYKLVLYLKNQDPMLESHPVHLNVSERKDLPDPGDNKSTVQPEHGLPTPVTYIIVISAVAILVLLGALAYSLYLACYRGPDTLAQSATLPGPPAPKVKIQDTRHSSLHETYSLQYGVLEFPREQGTKKKEAWLRERDSVEYATITFTPSHNAGQNPKAQSGLCCGPVW